MSDNPTPTDVSKMPVLISRYPERPRLVFVSASNPYDAGKLAGLQFPLFSVESIWWDMSLARIAWHWNPSSREAQLDSQQTALHLLHNEP